MMHEIDVTHVAAAGPFWMLVRWDRAREDMTEAEREEAAKAGVTDFDDFGCGLCYNKKADAELVAAAMVKRFTIRFGVEPS